MIFVIFLIIYDLLKCFGETPWGQWANGSSSVHALHEEHQMKADSLHSSPHCDSYSTFLVIMLWKKNIKLNAYWRCKVFDYSLILMRNKYCRYQCLAFPRFILTKLHAWLFTLSHALPLRLSFHTCTSWCWQHCSVHFKSHVLKHVWRATHLTL